jgi:four helix bundle protein
MKDFRDLKVWERAHLLTLNVYKITAAFPRDERFGLTSQVRRCNASIGANIAEGCGNGEFQRFCGLHPDPQASSTTTCCWLETWVSCTMMNTGDYYKT